MARTIDTPTQAERTQWWTDPLPVRLGWLNDNPPFLENLPIVEFVIERFNALKRIDRKVELCLLRAQGAPAGRIRNIFEAYVELKDMGCLAIMGPSISDACVEISDLVQEHKVPTITSGATAQAIGEWFFDISWGGTPEEPYIIANWLVREGHKRVGVCYDTAYHSHEYLTYFREAARRARIEICGEYRINQLDVSDGDDDAERALASLRGSNIDAIAVLSTGLSSAHVARAYQKSDWKPPIIMNDGWYGSASPGAAPLYEGIVGICGWDEENPVWANAYREFTQWNGGKEPQHPELFAIWYTIATAALEGISLAPILSTEGVRQGMERITMLPSAIGGPRSAINFNRWSHRGSGGCDLYVLRRIKDGKSVMEMRYDPMLAKLV
jgi:branched-chain amino acid transport system substrate-binding protein